LLILTVCLRDTFSLFATSTTVFPSSLTQYWLDGEVIASTAIGQRFAPSNPVRNGIAVYLHSAGIEAGYGFFAPNVPDVRVLIFELHYPDGRVEYDLPHVSNAATGLRLEGLLDQVTQIDYAPLRETMMKVLTYSSWREHPHAAMIRAVLANVSFPTAAEFENGESERFTLLYAYDFTFKAKAPP
jgi:hypothetical protein